MDTRIGGTHGLRLLSIAVICIAGALAHSNTLDSPFVFDDEPGIERNADIRITAIEIDQLYRAGFSEPSTRRPVANVSFALNYYLGGYDVTGYHVVNVAIHILGGVLVYLLMFATLRLAGGLPGQGAPRLSPGSVPLVALVAALIFVTHPIQTQAVTFVVQRMTSLATVFCLASLLSYVQGRLLPSGWRRHAMFASALLAWLMALGSKEIAATLPVLALLYEWFFFQDLDTRWLRSNGWLVVVFTATLALVTYVFIGASPVERILSTYEHRDFTIGERVLTQLRVIFFYLSLILFPHPGRLNLLHDFSTSHSLVDPLTTALSLVGLLVVIATAIGFARRHRLVSFFVFWFLLGLAMESSVVGLEMVFEHRLYLPMFACSGLAAAMLFHAFAGREKLALVVSSLLVFALASASWSRNATWSDEVTFWTDVVAKNPRSHRGHTNLGIVKKELGDSEAAIRQYREALLVKPDYEVALNNLGNELRNRGELDAAIEHYLAAIRSKPDYLSAHYNLGRALATTGKLEEASARFAEIVRVKPEHAEARYALGSALLHLERLGEATEQLSIAVRLAPDSADARYDLGIALARQGHCAEALPHFSASVLIDPADDQARAALAECQRRLSIRSADGE